MGGLGAGSGDGSGAAAALGGLRRLRFARKAAASFSGEDLGIKKLWGETGKGALSFVESLRYSSAPLTKLWVKGSELRSGITTVAVVA